MKTNEQKTSDPIEIIKSLNNFYSSLYTRRSNKTEDECIAPMEVKEAFSTYPAY